MKEFEFSYQFCSDKKTDSEPKKKDTKSSKSEKQESKRESKKSDKTQKSDKSQKSDKTQKGVKKPSASSKNGEKTTKKKSETKDDDEDDEAAVGDDDTDARSFGELRSVLRNSATADLAKKLIGVNICRRVDGKKIIGRIVETEAFLGHRVTQLSLAR